ncbi:MAG: winged helix-turn-helix transcriptional regulator [Candidatus Thermoplasmatota archaeon]|nr:winged helix-turn-helix transcriptional regulator [Candidatus Thermoplasmatota archaeon]
MFVTAFKRKHYVPAPAQKTVEKTVGKILVLIKENPKITREELSAKTGLTIRGIEWNLARLKEKGILKRIGPAKGGHWEIKD